MLSPKKKILHSLKIFYTSYASFSLPRHHNTRSYPLMKFSNMAYNGKRKASEVDEVSGDDTVRVNFSIRAQDGSKVFFKVNPDRYLSVPFTKYCQQSNLEYGTVTFLLEGKRINGYRQTPRTLKLKNGAEIDVMKQQTGGGDEAL